MLFYVFIGVMCYGASHGCHPNLDAPDQIFPHFVRERLASARGLSGLLLAAVYAAGISTVTASYNALTSVIIEDLIGAVIKRRSANAADESAVALSVGVRLRLIQILRMFFFALKRLVCAQNFYRFKLSYSRSLPQHSPSSFPQ